MTASAFDPGIDVVVVNYRTPDLLENFLNSYAAQLSEVPTTLHVADVTPLEAFPEGVLKDLGTWTEFDENVGYSGACNELSTLGNHEVVAFFNADTELFDHTLDECHSALMENDGWGVLGPMQVDAKGHITHAGTEGGLQGAVPRGWRSKNLTKYRDVIECPTVFGSAYFVKRACWNELTQCPIYQDSYPEVVGAFLPTPHYYEETWCSYHAFWHGWRVVYYGMSTMLHHWHRASPVGGTTEREYMPRSKKMFQEMCDQHGIPHD